MGILSGIGDRVGDAFNRASASLGGDPYSDMSDDELLEVAMRNDPEFAARWSKKQAAKANAEKLAQTTGGIMGTISTPEITQRMMPDPLMGPIAPEGTEGVAPESTGLLGETKSGYADKLIQAEQKGEGLLNFYQQQGNMEKVHKLQMINKLIQSGVPAAQEVGLANLNSIYTDAMKAPAAPPGPQAVTTDDAGNRFYAAPDGKGGFINTPMSGPSLYKKPSSPKTPSSPYTGIFTDPVTGERKGFNNNSQQYEVIPGVKSGIKPPKNEDDMGSIPSGWQKKTVNGETVLAPQKGSKDYTNASQTYLQAHQGVQTVKEMRDLIEEHGSEISGEVYGQMGQKYGQIMSIVAELQRKGVLQAGEVEMIQNQLTDPTTPGAVFTNTSTMLAQYDGLLADLTNRLNGISDKFKTWGYEPPKVEGSTPQGERPPNMPQAQWDRLLELREKKAKGTLE